MFGNPNRKLSLEEKFSVCNRVQKYMDDNPGTNFKTACKSLSIDIGEYYNIRGYCRKVASAAPPEKFEQLTKIGLEPKSVKAVRTYKQHRTRRDERLIIRPKNYKSEPEVSTPMQAQELVPKTETAVHHVSPETTKEYDREEVSTPTPAPAPAVQEPLFKAKPIEAEPTFKEITLRLSPAAYEFLQKRAELYVLTPEAIASVLLHEAIARAIQQKKD